MTPQKKSPPPPLLILLCLALTTTLLAQPLLAQDNSSASASPDSVFHMLEKSWQEADEVTLASLVHSNGLRVTHGGNYDRFTIYSPDQAFYYFQDLFNSRKTESFSFRRLTEPVAEGPFFGMVEWSYLMPERSLPEVLKFVVVLDHDGSQWRFTQFNSISQR